MPGKSVLGIVADIRREDEGEYVCPRSTIFGLENVEVKALISLGLQLTDRNKDVEGYEVLSSAFKLMRILGEHMGYYPNGDPACTEGPGGRSVLIYTMVKDL
ncbi:uncharacterized protein [Lepeophtheirus salmonis]|nr:uncharacterized protein LOC121124885 [Lepeophtheirus salmonis]